MKTLKIVTLVLGIAVVCGCDLDVPVRASDERRQLVVERDMKAAQPTPTDIQYSLERYNLIRRAYWVNGMRERAVTVPCPVVKPIGYIVLVTGSGAVLGSFVVDGKLSSLNSYLTPESEYYDVSPKSSSLGDTYNRWLADTDGCYGSNDKNGVFWFTPDGKYMEWSGTYLYSDIPFQIQNPVLHINNNGGGL